MNDMYADAVLTLCLQIEANPQAIKQSSLRSITQVKLVSISDINETTVSPTLCLNHCQSEALYER